MHVPLRNMAKLHPIHSLLNFTACFLSFMAIIFLSSSARTLENSTRNRHRSHHHKISFLMRDVLNMTYSSSMPTNTKVTGQLPFSKPLGFFPPNRGIPIPKTYTTLSPGTGFSPQTLDLSTIGISFPARAALQELEFGVVTEINEELFEISGHVLKVVGKIEGFYVANCEDGGGHMMAMTVYFGKSDQFKDGVKLFGVYKNDMKESHIAVIGGIGKSVGANGYASLKKLVVNSRGFKEKFGANYKLMEFNVYLSK